MTKLDNTFLTVHPRTRLWWEQRNQCEKCKNCHHVGTALTCFAPMPVGYYPSEAARIKQAGGRRPACIDAREEGMRCGPNAQLFQPKE